MIDYYYRKNQRQQKRDCKNRRKWQKSLQQLKIKR